MPLETLDRTPPPFFRQGPSALSRLLFFSALALFLMVADARFHMVQPMRASISGALYAAQWLVLQPVQWGRTANQYITGLDSARREASAERALLIEQSRRAGQVEALLAENQHLRALLGLRQRVDATKATTAQVLYDATDPYTRQVVIDKGRLQGLRRGSPVIDEAGVIGQVTNVYPFVSEVTLLVDRDQAIPVLNPRTGLRSIAYGNPTLRGGVLELRYVSATEDVHVGDLLTTSGIDGVYPPGLPVARVLSVEHLADNSFARILCQPLAHLSGVTQVMVLQPVDKPSANDVDQDGAQLPPLAKVSSAASADRSVLVGSAASAASRSAARLADVVRAARARNTGNAAPSRAVPASSAGAASEARPAARARRPHADTRSAVHPSTGASSNAAKDTSRHPNAGNSADSSGAKPDVGGNAGARP